MSDATPESATTAANPLPRKRGNRLLWIAGPLVVAVVAGSVEADD